MGYILLVMCIIFVIAGHCLFVCGNERCNTSYYSMGFGCFLMVPVLLVTGVGLIFGSSVRKTAAEYDAMVCFVQDHAEDFSFYLDGDEVAYETVDIGQYSVSVDLEEQKVFLAARKGGGSPFYLPFFYPAT